MAASTRKNTIYSGSSDLDTVGWYQTNSTGADCDLSSGRGTWPVGQKTPNELNQQDMSGNVAEWYWDSSSGGRRVRGGSWSDVASECALATRSEASADTRSDTIGFRATRNFAQYDADTLPIITLLTPTDVPLEPAKIFVVSDSTAVSYNSGDYPMRGWGQELQHFLTDQAFIVQNRARGGRSSRSYIEDRHLGGREGGDRRRRLRFHPVRSQRPRFFRRPNGIRPPRITKPISPPT